MNKIMTKIKDVYNKNEDIIKFTTLVVGCGIATVILCDDLRMRGELKNLKDGMVDALKKGNDELIKSQSIVRDLIEQGKDGGSEWHDEVVNSVHLYSSLNMMCTILDKMKKI